MNASYTCSCTTTRLAAVQRWPVVPNPPHRQPSIASSSWASSMIDDDVLATHLEMHLLERGRGVLIDHAAHRRGSGERHDRHLSCVVMQRADVRAADDEVDHARLGTPASSSTSTKLIAESGVSVAGLNTTVLPQTSAGTIFHEGIAIGKFHGVITERRRAAGAPTWRTCRAARTARSGRTGGALRPP